jgi:hypothetical protein
VLFDDGRQGGRLAQHRLTVELRFAEPVRPRPVAYEADHVVAQLRRAPNLVEHQPAGRAGPDDEQPVGRDAVRA